MLAILTLIRKLVNRKKNNWLVFFTSTMLLASFQTIASLLSDKSLFFIINKRVDVFQKLVSKTILKTSKS